MATRAVHAVCDPVAFDCVQLVVVRCGSAFVFGEAGMLPVRAGDVVAVAPCTLYGLEPEGWATVTTIYLAREYLIDQMFWRCFDRLRDRLDAAEVFDARYVGPIQTVRLDADRAGLLMPWLDELALLSAGAGRTERFYRVQALLSSVLDVVVPRLRVHAESGGAHDGGPLGRGFVPVRAEARAVAGLLREAPERRWTLAELAGEVHLSPAQLGRVFSAAFGRAPLTYLATVRVERMALLLRTTDDPVTLIARQLGWSDPDYAGRVFRRNVGMSPRAYRTMTRHPRCSDAPHPLLCEPDAASSVRG